MTPENIAALIERLKAEADSQDEWAEHGESTVIGAGPPLMREAATALDQLRWRTVEELPEHGCIVVCAMNDPNNPYDPGRNTIRFKGQFPVSAYAWQYAPELPTPPQELPQ